MKQKNTKESRGKSPRKRARSAHGSIHPDAHKLLPPEESQEIVLAIRRGKIDALVMAGKSGEEVLMLQNTDQPYRVLVETINDGVATLDASGTILYANRRMAAILRVPFDRFLGSSWLDHISLSDRKMLQALIADGLSNSATGEITLHPAEGRPRLVRVALNPIKDSHPPTACIVATELTEMVEANEALRVNEESLRQLSGRLLKLQDEERRRIARDLHDITGQKLAVQSMCLSQLLNRKPASPDADSQRLLSECALLNKQVGDEIRTLSYLLHPPLLDELGLSSAVKWYTEGFQRRTGIQVKLDIDPNLVRLAPDAEVTLFRIVQESLSNVHRYSGSARAQIHLKVTADEIEMKITDFGKGMHDVLNPKNGKVAPLGVGIQGMKERIRQLGGTLEITSQPGKGTVVTAAMPLTQEAAPAAIGPSPSEPPAVADESVAPRANGSSSRILIVDDHEMLRQGLRSMLEKEADLEVCGEAVDGKDAVKKAVSLRPDLVILDINLPELNGLVAVRQILRQRPHTKILVFTVHDSEQTAKEIRAAGAHAYLSKGTGSDDLLRVVRGLLHGDVPTTSSIAVAD